MFVNDLRSGDVVTCHPWIRPRVRNFGIVVATYGLGAYWVLWNVPSDVGARFSLVITDDRINSMENLLKVDKNVVYATNTELAYRAG